jgi:BTB/POZ domain-containing protein 9
MDREDWFRVADYTNFLCRSWQKIYFAPKTVRYIRVIGTYNTANKVFHLVHLEAMYSTTQFQLDNSGILYPLQNVASDQMGASVLEGVSRTRNALLNGDTDGYDWDTGYTCHQLGSGAIVVQLPQPYIIDSMRLLLWDCDDRSYSYFIETSTDQVQWVRVVDNTKEPCRSWQNLEIQPQPVSFIRIVGTHNTANEVFHCVHFECPASSSLRRRQQQQPTPSGCSTASASKKDSSADPGACSSSTRATRLWLEENGKS